MAKKHIKSFYRTQLEARRQKIKVGVIVFILLIITAFIIASVSATLTFEPGKNADIKIGCVYADYSLCTSDTYCNITIFYPNMTLLVNNQLMTKNGTFYNFTLLSPTERGIYQNIVNCWTSANVSGFDTFPFIISNIPATEQGNVAVGIIISIVALTFLFLIISFKFLDTETLFPIGLFFMCLSLIFAVYGLYLGYTYANEILLSSSATSTQTTIFLSVMWGLMAIAFIGLTWLTIKAIKEIRERKSMVDYGEGWNPQTKSYS